MAQHAFCKYIGLWQYWRDCNALLVRGKSVVQKCRLSQLFASADCRTDHNALGFVSHSLGTRHVLGLGDGGLGAAQELPDHVHWQCYQPRPTEDHEQQPPCKQEQCSLKAIYPNVCYEWVCGSGRASISGGFRSLLDCYQVTNCHHATSSAFNLNLSSVIKHSLQGTWLIVACMICEDTRHVYISNLKVGCTQVQPYTSP